MQQDAASGHVFWMRNFFAFPFLSAGEYERKAKMNFILCKKKGALDCREQLPYQPM